MNASPEFPDLVPQRVVDIAPARWRMVECAIDRRPGAVFRTLMQSSEGQTFPHSCRRGRAQGPRADGFHEAWAAALDQLVAVAKAG
jgi:hypothetical protein